MNKIAVITPYFREATPVLLNCIRSVATQNVHADHFMVADGYPNDEISNEKIKHVVLPQAHADNGNTPRGIGSLLAACEGYEFIAYLDADNWYHPNHLSSLLDLWTTTGSDVCASFRTFHTLEGKEIYVAENMELQLKHVDTSCLFIHRNAFSLLNVWLDMPKALSPICDRMFFSAIVNSRYRLSSTRQKTVAFRSQYTIHYLAAGLTPPEDAKGQVVIEALQWLETKDGIRETFSRLGFCP